VKKVDGSEKSDPSLSKR